MKSFLFSVLLLIPALLSAQQQIGHLTIFSEDGDKFFVMLNGEKQNTMAQSNLRIEDLPQPYYSAKIIFEDGSPIFFDRDKVRSLLRSDTVLVDIDLNGETSNPTVKAWGCDFSKKYVDINAEYAT